MFKQVLLYFTCFTFCFASQELSTASLDDVLLGKVKQKSYVTAESVHSFFKTSLHESAQQAGQSSSKRYTVNLENKHFVYNSSYGSIDFESLKIDFDYFIFDPKNLDGVSGGYLIPLTCVKKDKTSSIIRIRCDYEFKPSTTLEENPSSKNEPLFQTDQTENQENTTSPVAKIIKKLNSFYSNKK